MCLRVMVFLSLINGLRRGSGGSHIDVLRDEIGQNGQISELDFYSIFELDIVVLVRAWDGEVGDGWAKEDVQRRGC
ncbi:hypothetical protein LINPERPRIM_LOCUS16244 [Linum perenne]